MCRLRRDGERQCITVDVRSRQGHADRNVSRSRNRLRCGNGSVVDRCDRDCDRCRGRDEDAIADGERERVRPLKFAAGVYVRLAPEPVKAPCVGALVTTNDKVSPSGSLPVRVTGTATSSGVETVALFAVGGLLVWVTVIDTTATFELTVPSFAV